MNTKRLFCSALLLLAICPVISAQNRVDIITRDRTVTSIDVDNFNYMDLVNSAGPGELDGPWYLGWKITNSSTTKGKGEEVIVFSSGKMKWIKKDNSENNYALTYPESGAIPGAVIQGFRDGNTYPSNFTIFAMEDSLLVLKQGSATRYYFYKTKEKAVSPKTISGYYTRQQCATGEQVWNAGIKGSSSHSNKTPMGKHFESYRAATADDIAWLAEPNNQPDLTWHELSGTWTARTVNLYPFGSPVPADVNQTTIGDCSMCAVFASFAYIYPEWIKTIIERDGNNFTVHMFDPKGNPVDVVVDNKFIGGQLRGKNNTYCWSSVMEKALMKWETRFQCNKIGGIGTEHAAPPFTGNGDSYAFNWGDKMYNSEYALLVDYVIDNGMISVGGFHESDVPMGDLKSVTGHAFTVMKADEGADYLFVMRNPWGNEPDGSTSSNRTDGKLKIPNDHEKLRLIDFRIVYPGAQMAPYKIENLGGYTPPRFKATYQDMNPSEEMLRRYGVKNYVPVLPKENDAFVPDLEYLK